MSDWKIQFYYKDPANDQIYDDIAIINDWTFYEMLNDAGLRKNRESIIDHLTAIDIRPCEHE